jgi:hypothetical protein
MIDIQDVETGYGILVDMSYQIVDGIEKVIDVIIYEVINNVVGGIAPVSSPLVKLAFASNFLSMLEIERNKE